MQQHGWSQRLLYWVKSDGEREISHDIIYMQNLYKPVMQMNLITKQKQTHRLKRRNSWELLSFYSFASSFLQQTKQHFTFFFFFETFLDYGYIWLHTHCLHHVTPMPNIQFHLLSTCDLEQNVSSLSIGFPVHIMGLNSTTQPIVARAMYVKALCKLTRCIELPRWC